MKFAIFNDSPVRDTSVVRIIIDDSNSFRVIICNSVTISADITVGVNASENVTLIFASPRISNRRSFLRDERYNCASLINVRRNTKVNHR